MDAFVEIDENERYWVGKGFGKGGLLINDRGAFSSTDGSLSWKSIEEASKDSLFLGRGWTFCTDEDFIPTRQDEDGGWMYAADFRPSSIADARPTRGNLHFVRFRRLIKRKTFHPEKFVNESIYEKCDHCDSKEMEGMSKLLLEVIAYISLLSMSDNTLLTDAVLLPIKAAVIDTAVDHELSSDKPERDVTQDFVELRKKLMLHVERERYSYAMMPRLLSSSSFLFGDRDKYPEFHERCTTVEARCLPTNERDAIAGLILRKLDPGFHLHCNKAQCGTDCVFRRVSCPHEGCTARMSQIHLDAHMKVCRYKKIICECGEAVRAGDMQAHLRDTCTFRLIDCPFKSIGCTKRIRVCDLEKHLAEDMASHLLLAVDQITSQKDELLGLRGSLEVLQAENQALNHVIKQQKENFSTKIGDLSEYMTRVDKELEDFENTYHKEIRILKSPKKSVVL